FLGRNQTLKVLVPQLEALAVRHRGDAVGAEVGGVDVSFQAGRAGANLAGLGAANPRELAVAAVRQASLGAQVPQEAGLRICNRIVVQIEALSASTGVHARP